VLRLISSFQITVSPLPPQSGFLTFSGLSIGVHAGQIAHIYSANTLILFPASTQHMVRYFRVIVTYMQVIIEGKTRKSSQCMDGKQE
jgi:hypothetical protein